MGASGVEPLTNRFHSPAALPLSYEPVLHWWGWLVSNQHPPDYHPALTLSYSPEFHSRPRWELHHRPPPNTEMHSGALV